MRISTQYRLGDLVCTIIFGKPPWRAGGGGRRFAGRRALGHRGGADHRRPGPSAGGPPKGSVARRRGHSLPGRTGRMGCRAAHHLPAAGPHLQQAVAHLGGKVEAGRSIARHHCDKAPFARDRPRRCFARFAPIRPDGRSLSCRESTSAHRLQSIIDRPGEQRIEPEAKLPARKNPGRRAEEGEVQEEPQEDFRREREAHPARAAACQ